MMLVDRRFPFRRRLLRRYAARNDTARITPKLLRPFRRPVAASRLVVRESASFPPPLKRSHTACSTQAVPSAHTCAPLQCAASIHPCFPVLAFWMLPILIQLFGLPEHFSTDRNRRSVRHRIPARSY